MDRGNKRIVLLLGIIIAVLLVAILTISMQAEKIVIEGNEHYTEQEIRDYIFNSSYEKNIMFLWVKNKLGKAEEIPFVEKYDVEIMSLREVKVTIYEKSIVGYIDYLGNYMYFDKDGVVVESSTRKIEGVPRVTGIDVKYIILHEKLPVEDSSVFHLILTVTQTLNKYKLNVDKIYISKNQEITLYMKNVKIFLGKNDDLSEKISDLDEMASKFEGFSGTIDMSVLDTEGDGYTMKKDVKDSNKNNKNNNKKSNKNNSKE